MHGTINLKLDLLIAISNTILNSIAAIAYPRLKPLLTLNLEYKCLPILTSAYISLFEILHNLTNFLGEAILCILHHTNFLHSVICCLKINK